MESLLLLLLSKRKHRSNNTAPVQPQLPDKVCQDLPASLCKHPQKPLRSCRQQHQRAQARPALLLSVPSVSFSVTVCLSASLCVFLDISVTLYFPALTLPVSLSYPLSL